jgi:hypothetical protein
VTAHVLELGDHLLIDGLVDDDSLLGRADHRGVEGLGDEHVDHGAFDVGRAVEVDGRVARPDADAGLAGSVGELDDLGTAGRPQEVDARVLEQVVGDLVRGVRDHLERPGRHAGRLCSRGEDRDGALGRAHGVRRGAEQHRVASLGRDDRLEQHRRGRVRDRGDRHDHADRLGEEVDVPLVVVVDDADALLIL